MAGTAQSVGRGREVLVVEDNARSRRLVRDLLDLHGFEVVEAETAEQGLDAARQQRPDLVLLDVQLPGMDGVGALQALRADAELKTIPVVAVTAFAMRGDEDRFLSEGFDSYISKPIDVRTFVDQLCDVLDRGTG